MQHRSKLVAGVLLAALIPAGGEAATRMSFTFAKSFHPDSERDYSTAHPGIGVTGRLAGEWLRWRVGLVRHSHSRWGPVTGIAATWEVTESWRAGFSAGIVGNYARGEWVRRGVLPIVQWKAPDRDIVWEFAVGRNEQVTFVGVNVQVPFSVLAAE